MKVSRQPVAKRTGSTRFDVPNLKVEAENMFLHCMQRNHTCTWPNYTMRWGGPGLLTSVKRMPVQRLDEVLAQEALYLGDSELSKRVLQNSRSCPESVFSADAEGGTAELHL